MKKCKKCLVNQSNTHALACVECVYQIDLMTGTYRGQKKTTKKEELQLTVNLRLNVIWYTAYK